MGRIREPGPMRMREGEWWIFEVLLDVGDVGGGNMGVGDRDADSTTLSGTSTRETEKGKRTRKNQKHDSTTDIISTDSKPSLPATREPTP